MPADGPDAAGLLNWMALPRVGTPDEAASMAGSEAAFITGAGLALDGSPSP
jgi:hypothetical protein